MMHAVMSSPRVGPYTAMKYGTDGLVAARNRVAEGFLKSGVEWLFWCDTDMGFTADTIDRLLADADPDERPIVGALCFANREIHTDGYGGFRHKPVPTLYEWVEQDDGSSGFSPLWSYPRDSLVRVAATGSACLVIHRSVFERVAERHGPTWYARMTNPTTGQLLGEDLSFCARAAEVGAAVWVDTSIKTTHLKAVYLQEDDYEHPGGE